MIKLDKRKPNTFGDDLYKARIEKALAAWILGRPVDFEDEYQSPKNEFRKEKEGEEEVPYVH